MQQNVFTNENYNQLCSIMAAKGVISEEKFTAVAYYMLSLSELHYKVFNGMLPRLLAILEEDEINMSKLNALIFDLWYEADEFVKLTEDSGLLGLVGPIDDDEV